MAGVCDTSPWTPIWSMSRRTSSGQDPLPSVQPGQVRRRRKAARVSDTAGYPTAYLWEKMWARDSVLDLIRQFIHEVEEEDEKGRKTGKAIPDLPAVSAARLRCAPGGSRTQTMAPGIAI